MAPNIIALMGATGSGKSSMIKLATGDERIVIGHGLTSREYSHVMLDLLRSTSMSES